MKHLLELVDSCIRKGIRLSDEELLAIAEKSGHDKRVYETILPLIEDQNNFMKLLSIVVKKENKEEKIRLILPYISITKKSDEELFAIVKTANNDNGAYQKIYPALKMKSRKKDDLVTMLKKSNYNWFFVEKIIPLLKLSKQKELFVWNLVKDSGFNYQISRHVIEFLSPTHALETILGNRFSSCICELGIKRIKKQENIYDVIVRSKFDQKTCENGIPKLSEKKKMALMKESNYDDHVCYIAIPLLKQTFNIRLIFEILQKDCSGYLCGALITQCKNEKSLMELIKSKTHKSDVLKKALISPILTSEDEILLLLENGFFAKGLITLALKKLNLKKKTEPQLLELMKKTNYQYEFCSKVIPFLELSKKTDEETVAFIKQHDNKYGDLCVVIITYLNNEEILLDLLKKNTYNKNFKLMFNSVVKKLKTETIEKFFMECNDEEALIIMVSFIHDDKLLAKLRKNNYSEKLCEEIVEWFNIPF